MGDLFRNDNEVDVTDDIEEVVTGAPEIASKTQSEISKFGSEAGRVLNNGVTTVGTGITATANTVMGVDKASDTTFNGDPNTAGGAAGFMERQAEQEIREREAKKQQKTGLINRYLDISDDAFNTLEQKYDLDSYSNKSKDDDEFAFNPFD